MTVASATTVRTLQIWYFFCGQLAQERKKVEVDESASTAKKKKRKHNKVASDKSDVVNSAKSDETVSRVKAETEFVPHDYCKANLKTLLQGTLCQ